MPKNTKILQKESLVLRKIAKEVPIREIGKEKINKMLSEMRQALNSQDDGVALAAPQIGYSLRAFVISPKVFEMTKKKKENMSDMPRMPLDTEIDWKDTVYINPVIIKLSKEKKSVEEGCLSVRYLYGQVMRSSKATIEAYDENGKKFIKGASGLLAQIFQHEVDHLNGVLFTDKAKYIEDLPPPPIPSSKSSAKSFTKK